MVHKYFRKSDLQNLILIIFISNLLYFHTYQSSFHLDDFSTVVDRPLIKNLNTFFDNASGIFSNRVFLLYSFALNYRIGGLGVFGYHLINIIIHITSSIFLYFLVKELIKSQSFDSCQHRKIRCQFKKSVPLLASLLFSIHPLQTESVTYISSRSTLAVTLCFLGSLFFFIKGSLLFFKPLKEIKCKIYFVGYFSFGALFFLLGVGFKETIIVLPLIFFLYMLLFHFQNLQQKKKVFIPICLLLLLMCIHAIGFLINLKEIEQLSIPLSNMAIYGKFSDSYQKSEFQKKSIEEAAIQLKKIKKEHHPIINLFYFLNDRPNILTNIYYSIYGRAIHIYSAGKESFSTKIYLLSELEIIGFYYIKLLFLPFNQSIFPDFPAFKAEHWKTFIFSLLIIFSIVFYSLSSNLKLITFSFFWYVITIMPSSSFLPLNDLVSEHRTYLPNIGFFLAISIGLSALLNSSNRFISLPFMLAIVVSLSILTLKRNYIWQNEVFLWEDAVKKSPGHIKSINALGVAYKREGKKEKALSVFQKSLNIDPFNYQILINMGRIYRDKGNLDKAEEHFRLASLISKDYLALVNLGSLYLEKDLHNQGIQELNKALQLNPYSFLAHYYLGNAYNDLKDYKKAIQNFKKSIVFNPDFGRAYNNLGYAYWNSGEYELAYELFVKAMNKNPELPDPYLNIGNYFLIKKNKQQAENFLNQYQEKLKNEKD